MVGRLPDDSLTRTTPESRRQKAQAEAWDVQAELLAQIVELTAVLAADQRTRGEPRKIPRPDWLGHAGGGQGSGPGRGPQDGFAYAIGVLRATSKNPYLSGAAGASPRP